MTEPEPKRQRTDEELKGMGVNELIALFKEAEEGRLAAEEGRLAAEEGRLAAEEDNRANQAKLHRLAMIAGKVPWVQCRTRADGSEGIFYSLFLLSEVVTSLLQLRGSSILTLPESLQCCKRMLCSRQSTLLVKFSQQGGCKRY
jgi:hypothetical protein